MSLISFAQESINKRLKVEIPDKFGYFHKSNVLKPGNIFVDSHKSILLATSIEGVTAPHGLKPNGYNANDYIRIDKIDGFLRFKKNTVGTVNIVDLVLELKKPITISVEDCGKLAVPVISFGDKIYVFSRETIDSNFAAKDFCYIKNGKWAPISKQEKITAFEDITMIVKPSEEEE